MNGCDLRESITDSLLLAHTLVAQGTLYFKQYRTDEYIHNNEDAAKLYKAIGRDILEIKSYANAIDGYIIMNRKSAADSILSICVPLVQKNPEGEAYLFPSLLSYTVELCSSDDIKAFLDEYQDLELTTDETMNFALGYSKIGEYDKALSLLSEISPNATALDSLKYVSVKIGILKKQGMYEQALNLYKDYSAMLERYQKELLSQDLLFSDKKHQLEMKNLTEIRDKDRIIGLTLGSVFVLIILVRPDPQVIWNTPKTNRGWKKMNAHYHRSKKGGGEWEFFDLPEQWTINYRDLTFNLKPFSFKHTGLFPEQAANWDWFSKIIKESGRKDLKVHR